VLSDKALDTFMRTSATMGPNVIEAHAARDWISLHSLAHRIKGASGYIAGERVNAAAHELQTCASRLMPAEEHSSVAQAASSFVSEADRLAASEMEMPSEALAAARVKVLLRCLDELAIEISENHRPTPKGVN
jgi:HPt (histidine-containing phosphotransfer) domain-containing protein